MPSLSHFPAFKRAYTEVNASKDVVWSIFHIPYPRFPSFLSPPFASTSRFRLLIPHASGFRPATSTPPAYLNFLPARSFHHQSFHPSETWLHWDFVIPVLRHVASRVQWFGKAISRTNHKACANWENGELFQTNNLFPDNPLVFSDFEGTPTRRKTPWRSTAHTRK